MKAHTFRRLTVVPAMVLALQALAPAASADHSWGTIHWARTSNPFTVTLASNLTAAWAPILQTTSTDWSMSSVLDTTIVAGSTRNAKRCPATSGRVEVCNSTYGKNGWLGIASVWTSGGHVAQAVVKLNDTYFAMPQYGGTAWKNLVMCQEVGHAFGLDHQDENFTNPNLGTCMDYTNSPETNQHPNAHDYEQLETIYAHLDTTTSVAPSASTGSAAAGANAQDEWGKAIRYTADGRPVLFVRELGGDTRMFTWVTWAA